MKTRIYIFLAILLCSSFVLNDHLKKQLKGKKELYFDLPIGKHRFTRKASKTGCKELIAFFETQTLRPYEPDGRDIQVVLTFKGKGKDLVLHSIGNTFVLDNQWAFELDGGDYGPLVDVFTESSISKESVQTLKEVYQLEQLDEFVLKTPEVDFVPEEQQKIYAKNSIIEASFRELNYEELKKKEGVTDDQILNWYMMRSSMKKFEELMNDEPLEELIDADDLKELLDSMEGLEDLDELGALTDSTDTNDDLQKLLDELGEQVDAAIEELKKEGLELDSIAPYEPIYDCDNALNDTAWLNENANRVFNHGDAIDGADIYEKGDRLYILCSEIRKDE